eukprot:gene39164-47653_t
MVVAAVVAEDAAALLTPRQKENAAADKALSALVKAAKEKQDKIKPVAAVQGNLRAVGNKDSSAMFHNDEEKSGIVFLREFLSRNDCSGESVRDTVLFNKNPSFLYTEDDFGASGRVKYGCSLSTGEIWADLCRLDDKRCKNPTQRVVLGQSGVCTPADDTLAPFGFVGECMKNINFLSEYRGRDATVGFPRERDVDDYSKAMYIRMYGDVNVIRELSRFDRDQECVYLANLFTCVDTRGVKSYVIIATGFDRGYVTTYSGNNGQGKRKRTNFVHEPLNAIDFYTVDRYLIKDWYSRAFPEKA